MIQWIITFGIVLLAFYYAGLLLFRYFRKKPAKPDECCECTSDCNNCPLNLQNLKS